MYNSGSGTYEGFEGPIKVGGLRACPFCGGPPGIEYKHGDWGYTDSEISVGCKKCDVLLSGSTEKWASGKGAFSVIKKVLPKLVKKWNGEAITVE